MGIEKGPQMSICIKAKAQSTTFWLAGTGNFFCFTKGQTIQGSLLLQETIGTVLFNMYNFWSEGWPNLMCQRSVRTADAMEGKGVVIWEEHCVAVSWRK